ncbi:Hint domain-containing protein [Oceaniglobus indicus]|uniref:Hint domain-containing protein n=1 Tax=Oceaniglobus indicus TaxID=2047749 RepID=UPI001F4D7F47|nr:Hint domain-containing protein [Oceaniglobus indicus]
MSLSMDHIGTFSEEPAQSLPVFHADLFRVVDGANLGDPMGHAGDLMLGDIYMLTPGARRTRLAVTASGASGALTIAPGTECGSPGAMVHLDCCATLMSPDGTTVEALVLVELDDTQTAIADVRLFPLAKLKPRLGYALVALDRAAARARFAEAACVSFTRGTRITLASGRMAPIETLAAGQSVLTRDHGPQKIRWIGQQTVRAHGAFAPIRIKAGTLRNEEDLIVSPNHRLFVYQRRDTLKAGRAEVLIKAKYLLNDDTVTRTDGGFVDYFQLLFDRHEIIYAEGIAAESLMVDTRTRPALPSELQAQLAVHDNRTDALGYTLPRAGTAGQMLNLLQNATRR